MLGYGENLGGPLARHDTWKQLLGVAEALEELSKLNEDSTDKLYPLCIYLNVKPRNILVLHNGTWVISDFGLVALTDPVSGGSPQVQIPSRIDAYAHPRLTKSQWKPGNPMISGRSAVES